MNNIEFASLLSDIYKKSFFKIMANYKCDVTECNDCHGVIDFSSSVIIDAGSKDFEMCIALKMPFSSLEQSIPLDPGDGLIDEGQLEDWLCEISNLVVGAVKEDLLKRQCRLQIGLPKCSAGKELKNIIPKGYEHSSYHFVVEHECCESIMSLHFLGDQTECLDAEHLNQDHAARSELEVF